jgi:DNA-binding MarR family transcriptional regulator
MSRPLRKTRLAYFERDLLFLLNDVARLLRVDADKRARAHGMTRAQWAILIWLERQPGISQKELAELLEVEPITVARLVDRLEGRAMVERRPDPRDRRIWRLHLLLPAHLVLREISQQRSEMAAMVTHGVDEDSQTIMIEALARMKATLTRDSHPNRRAPEPRQPGGHEPEGPEPEGHQPGGHQPEGHQPGHQPEGHQPEEPHPQPRRPAAREVV